jgi:hypothetical protein
MARHKKEPKKFPGFEIGRGELVTSLAQISDACEYKEGKGVKRWNRMKVSRLLHRLQEYHYIELLRYSYGTCIRVCNYDRYQSQETYKKDIPLRNCYDGVTMVLPYNNGKNVNKKEKAADAVGVHNASTPQKIDETLDILADKLKSEKIFPQAKGFVTTWKNKGKNRGAILHALNAVYIKKKFKAGPWAYARKVLDVENGNYNEAESLLEHKNIKTEGVDPKIVALADKVGNRVDEREDRIRELRKQAEIIQGEAHLE